MKETCKGSDILKQLEYDSRYLLEYGIPLHEVQYRKLKTIPFDFYSNDLYTVNGLMDDVEAMAKHGEYGCFILEMVAKDDLSQDVLELWGWDPQ